jgi:hypothetical protein
VHGVAERVLRFGVAYGTATVAAGVLVGLVLPVAYQTAVLGLTILAALGAFLLLSGGDNPAEVDDPEPMDDWRKDGLAYAAGVFLIGWLVIGVPRYL